MAVIPPSNHRLTPVRYGKTWTKGGGTVPVPQTYTAAQPNTGTVQATPPPTRLLGAAYVTKAIAIPSFTSTVVVPYICAFSQLPSYPQTSDVFTTLANVRQQGSFPKNALLTSQSDTLTLITNIEIQRPAPSAGVFLVDFYSIGYGVAVGGNVYPGPVLQRGVEFNIFQARGHVTFGGSSPYSGGENCTLLIKASLYIQSN